MARKSRKIAQDAAVFVSAAKMTFLTAVYARLSSEDREALSLENQILMVRNYIGNMPDLTFCDVFSDNGLTGTNFDRPGFESLMDEIRRGKINCIVVKDLSRFGRDYLEAGNFLEVIFPRLGVRFISIGDNYDSFDPRCQGDGMNIALKNMINSFYAKDISTKIRSAYAVKRQNGEFTGKCPPFGYIKSPKNKNRLVVDEEAAEIVRMIFRLKLEGLGAYQIARHLSGQNTPTPGHYRYIKGIHKEKRYEKPQFWDTATVKDILENIAYLGHLALGKTRIVNGKQRDVPKEDWVIAENTHEPIISQADFDAVAELLQQRKERHNSQNRHEREELPDNILEGLVFCADCGRAYRRIANTMRDKVTYRLTYICLYCNQHSPKYKHRHYKPDELYRTIYEIIQSQIDAYVETRRLIDKIRISRPVKQKQDKMDGEIRKLQQEISRLPARHMKLYDDFCDGVLSESEYKEFKARYDADEKTAAARLQELTDERSRLQPQFVDKNVCITEFERFRKEKVLTREMLTALVERIEVTGDRNVEIKFRFRDEYAPLGALLTENGEKIPGSKTESEDDVA